MITVGINGFYIICIKQAESGIQPDVANKLSLMNDQKPLQLSVRITLPVFALTVTSSPLLLTATKEAPDVR